MLVVKHTWNIENFDIYLNSETIPNQYTSKLCSVSFEHLLTVRSHTTILGITNLVQSNFKA